MLRLLPLLSLAALAAGCGRLGFEEAVDAGADGSVRDGGGTDAGLGDGGLRDAGRVGDAGPDAGGADAGPGVPAWRDRPLCGFGAGEWTLTEPEPVAAVNEAERSELEPHLLPGGRTLYFSAFSSGTIRVFESERADAESPFGAPSAVAGLGDDTFNVYHVAPLADLLDGVVATDRAGGAGESDLWLIDRSADTDPWAFRGPIPFTNSPGAEHDPWVSEDGLRLYFVSDGLSGGAGQALFTCVRPSLGASFGSASVISELDTAENEDNPSLTVDELTIVFGSNRPGGAGNLDLYIATRESRTGAFGEAAPILPLNTAARESESHLSADGCELFYTRFDVGNGDVYVSRVVAR